MIVSLYKGKVEKTECKNYRGISLLTVIGKIYTQIVVDRVHRVTGGLIDDEQGERVCSSDLHNKAEMQCVCELYIFGEGV